MPGTTSNSHTPPNQQTPTTETEPPAATTIKPQKMPRRFSFRDDTASVYRRNSSVFRFISRDYGPNYQKLMKSGLYKELIDRKLLISHREVESPEQINADINYITVIKPQTIPFISYPYEWSFSQLKDAALLTLEIQETALRYGMTLKDANAWNVQFLDGKPIFIDTSSFEIYREGSPWGAYGQFSQYFLLPLVLMARRDIRLNSLLISYPEGVPLELGVKLIPWTCWTNVSLASHLLATAFTHNMYKKKPGKSDASVKLPANALHSLVENLKNTIEGIRIKEDPSTWSDYYNDNTYSRAANESKHQIIESILSQKPRNIVWDMGANTGVYSKLASNYAKQVLAFDSDPLCVEKHYCHLKQAGETTILPILMNCAAPSPALGWAHSERLSLNDRAPCDLLMALALIHHISIGNSIDFARVSEYFHSLTKELIIEFVPRDDAQVVRLLEQRTNDCPGYNSEHFEEAFLKDFTLISKTVVADSQRTIYHFSRKENEVTVDCAY
jgi:hypothetical protein